LAEGKDSRALHAAYKTEEWQKHVRPKVRHLLDVTWERCKSRTSTQHAFRTPSQPQTSLAQVSCSFPMNLPNHFQNLHTCDDFYSLTVFWQLLATTFLGIVRNRDGVISALMQSHTSTGQWHYLCGDGICLTCWTDTLVMRKGLQYTVFPCKWQRLSGCTQEAQLF